MTCFYMFSDSLYTSYYALYMMHAFFMVFDDGSAHGFILSLLAVVVNSLARLIGSCHILMNDYECFSMMPVLCKLCVTLYA